MKRGVWGFAAILAAGVSVVALITSFTFGGDLSDYQAAPACASNQHSSGTSCRETLNTTVKTVTNASPCQATFAKVDTTPGMECSGVWSSLRPGANVTLVLWHDDVVSVSDSAGSEQTTSYPQSTGPAFLVVAAVLGVVALIFTGLWWLERRNIEGSGTREPVHSASK
jgi:hypothetical protein